MLSDAAFRTRTFWPRQIVQCFRPLFKPAGPAFEYFGHAIRLDAELCHGDAAVDGFAVFGDQAVAHHEAADAVDHHALAFELRDLRDEARQRPGISYGVVEHRIEHPPAIIRSIAMKQILHHMRDVRPALMRAINVVVINGVIGEMAGEARAVAGFRRQCELVQQACEFVAGHVASPCLAGASLWDRHYHICKTEKAFRIAVALPYALFRGFRHGGRHARQPAIEKCLQPGPLGHVMDRAIGEVVMARPGARQFEPRMAARGPAMHHRVGHVGMKLEAERLVEAKRLNREIAALGQQFGAGGKFKSLAVPVVDVIRPIRADLEPGGGGPDRIVSNLRTAFRVRRHPRAELHGEHLRAQAPATHYRPGPARRFPGAGRSAPATKAPLPKAPWTRGRESAAGSWGLFCSTETASIFLAGGYQAGIIPK